MARVKVWNLNVHEHKEEFKGVMLEIPAKGFIEMDWEDAVQFRGQYTPMLIKADGTHDPRGFKMIKVDPPSEPIFKEAPLVNHATGQTASNAQELAKMLAEVAHLRAVDPAAEAEFKGKAGELEDLKAQVAALTALVREQTAPKKKPGPKPGFRKEAVG